MRLVLTGKLKNSSRLLCFHISTFRDKRGGEGVGGGDNRLEMSVSATSSWSNKVLFRCNNIQTTLILQSAIFNTSLRKWETNTCFYFIPISSSSLKKNNACHVYVQTTDSFFLKRYLRDTIFDDTTLHCLKPISHFESSLAILVFLFTSQANKSVLNWVILILIEQNIILKMWNQDFPPSKIEYVITSLKMTGEIDFIFVFGSIQKYALSR